MLTHIQGIAVFLMESPENPLKPNPSPNTCKNLHVHCDRTLNLQYVSLKSENGALLGYILSYATLGSYFYSCIILRNKRDSHL